MNNLQDSYLKDSQRTLSNNYRLDDTGPVQLTAALTDLLLMGFKADIMKRNIFYGTPQSELDEGKAKTHVETMNTAVANMNTKMNQLMTGGKQFSMGELVNLDLLHGLLGIVSEAGELAEALVNQFCTGQEPDKLNISEEIGDIQWYLAIFHRYAGVTPRETELQNIAKLRARYPVKFEELLSTNRDVEKERKVLEENHKLSEETEDKGNAA